MHIPEWQIKEAIAWHPDLIRLHSDFGEVKLVERQKYLKASGRYIDLLFKAGKKYYGKKTWMVIKASL